MSSLEETLACLKEALLQLEVVRELQSTVVSDDEDRWNIVLGIQEDLNDLIKKLTKR